MRLKLRFAVLAALLSMLGTLVVPGAVASATEHCPSPGGSDLTFEPDLAQIDGEDDVAITGGGWGHGVGMSQYGAQGAARLGCTHRQILEAYYRGVTVEPVEMPPDVRVGFLDPSHTAGTDISVDITTTSESAGGRAIAWRIDGCSSADCHPPDQPPGSTWKVRATDAGEYRITDVGSGDEVWRGGDEVKRLRVQHDGTVIRVQIPGFERRVKWGQTVFDSAEGADLGELYVIQFITPGAEHSAMERYLWGLAEVPSSWHHEALRTQAVAARSYAMNRQNPRPGCRCHMYATVRDQHYSGWDKEKADSEGRWRDAVNDTAVDATTADVMRYTDGNGNRKVADGFYSSSHGGWSDAAKDVWGGDVPYLQAVDTSGWEAESDNPRQRWTNGFTDEELAGAFGFDRFDELRIENRGGGGRPTVQDVDGDGEAPDGAVAVGRNAGGDTVRRWYSGEQLRSRLGVFSGLIHVHPLSDVPFQRLQDPEQPDRIGTATSMSRHGWPDGADTVVIARADDPADALAGATLAGQHDAPLMITFPHELHTEVAAEVERLGADRALLLGGVHALSEEVERGLEAAGVTDIERVAGADRVGTAVDIAESLEPESATDTAYLVYSAPGDPRSWPDALAVSGTAARRSAAGAPWPVLVTGKALPDATADELRKLGVEEVVLIGGNAVIPAEVEQQLQEADYTTRRLWGENRYGTSVQVAKEDDAPPRTLLAATGDAFPDGLAAGALAGRLDVTLLLVPSSELADVSREWVSGRAWEQPRLLVAGGVVAVSDQVVRSLRAALDDGSSDDATPTEDGS